MGALTGAMFGGLHGMEAGVGKVALHGLSGGVGSVLSGGKFGHGFFAAGFTQAMGNIKGLFNNNRLTNAIKAAVIGGTVSRLTGGKFASGAVTGAFSRLLNDDAGAVEAENSNTYFDQNIGRYKDNACRALVFNTYEKMRAEELNIDGETKKSWTSVQKSKSLKIENTDNTRSKWGTDLADIILDGAQIVNKGLGPVSTPLLDENLGPAMGEGIINFGRELRAKSLFNETQYLQWRNIPTSHPRKQFYLENPSKCC